MSDSTIQDQLKNNLSHASCSHSEGICLIDINRTGQQKMVTSSSNTQTINDSMKQNMSPDKMIPSSAAIEYLSTFNLSLGDLGFGSEMAGLEYGFLGDMVQTQLDPSLLNWSHPSTTSVSATSNEMNHQHQHQNNNISESILSENNIFPSSSTSTSVFTSYSPHIINTKSSSTSSSTTTFNNNMMTGSTLSTPLMTQHQLQQQQQQQPQPQPQSQPQSLPQSQPQHQHQHQHQSLQQSVSTSTSSIPSPPQKQKQKQRRRSYQSSSSTNTDTQLNITNSKQQHRQHHHPYQKQPSLHESMPLKQITSPSSSSTITKKGYATDEKPFNYAEGFHYLIQYVKEKMNKEDLMRISKALAKFRPSFLSLILSLTEDDLIFMEKCIQRTLLEYEKLISFSGTPTVVWRRTGEICLLGKEFCLLTQWTKELLLNKKTYIYELMDCGSAVEYWEHFSKHAFDNTDASCHYTCILRSPQNKSIPCTVCFMIKRDIFDLPSVIIGNFLPILS
ncbi:unnamed protein product [Cunninghamella echinulata]